MPKLKKGFYWHVHHEELLEWCHNYDERADYIRSQKEISEQELRLRLLQPVKGHLPKEVIEARQAYVQAKQACDRAWQAHEQARQARKQARQARKQARQAYVQAEQAYDRAWQAHEQARQAYEQALIDNKEELEKLHKLECKNCPWDGHTIFPN